MSLSESELAQVSAELLAAKASRIPVEPPTDRFPLLSYEEAYAIQARSIDTLLRRGTRTVGKKIGLTRKAAQDMMGYPEPVYGVLLQDMVAPEGSTVPIASLIRPRVEVEMAFVLKKDLEGPGVTVGHVVDATEGVMPAFEIVDSRYRDWRMTLRDSIADNVAAALVMLGGKLTPIRDIDLRLVGMVLDLDGAPGGTAAGAEVLDGPVNSVAWLANRLASSGMGLRKGEFVMSGSLVPGVKVKAGSLLTATFDRLGSLSLRFD